MEWGYLCFFYLEVLLKPSSHWQRATVYTKILCSTTVFNIDNNQKCFLSSKSAYYDFWRSCDTEDWSNDAENQLWSQEINYILTYIQVETSYLKCNNITVLLYFWSKNFQTHTQKNIFVFRRKKEKMYWKETVTQKLLV